MKTITITLPRSIYKLLQLQAEKLGKEPPELVREVVEQALSKTPVPSAAPDRSAAQVLQNSGRLRSLSPHLQEKIISGVTLDEVSASLQRVGGMSLSELVIEGRGPKA